MTQRYWTVWMLDNDYEVFDDEQDAYEIVAAYMNDDTGAYPTPYMVEGPNGEDLTAEFKAYAHKVFRRRERQIETAKRRAIPIGTVDVEAPDGKWFTGRVFSEQERDEEMREAVKVFGEKRVRFTPGPMHVE